MPNLPSGTVTFLFSDIEGSTALLKRLGNDRYAELLGQHRRMVREAFAAHEGQEIDTQGDAFFYSFARARQAVAAAVEVQRAHADATWPDEATVQVRIGLHTGEPAVGDEGYTGLDVVRAARIAAVGHGGQILLSEATRALVGEELPDGVAVRSLGEQRLKDIDRPEPLHELTITGLPTEPDGPMSTDVADVAVRPADEPLMPPGVTDALRHLPNWMRSAATPWVSAAADGARETIEARVLAEIKQAFEDDARGERMPEPPRPPGSASVADEIARLRELRDTGALSEEQYARAVDKVVGGA
ncbi:MAG TPA: adenylate/guanylate cyclase domain-containing protein [Candidatus Limnocylindria bacterium]|nr:adenylate/guanylate cyclase domain-containing protein [Candidatus Limnocylindria bacterium]